MFRGLLGGIRAEIVAATVLSSSGVRKDVSQLLGDFGADGSSSSHMLPYGVSSTAANAPLPSSSFSYTGQPGATGTALNASMGLGAGAGGRAGARGEGGGALAPAKDIIINHDADVCRQVKSLITSGFSKNGLQRANEDDTGSKRSKSGQLE